MAINYDRIGFEINSRITGTLQNREIENILKKRCMSAISCSSIKNLCEEIRVDCGSVASEQQVVEVLKTSGVMDLVAITINAQRR